jgi:hypothetical protein
MGKQNCRRRDEGLTYRVIPAEQGKSVSLPTGVGDRKAYDGDAEMRGGKKRMPFCNGADTGCIRNLDNITGRESELTFLWCNGSRYFL